jgi:hypothetical protein
MAAARRPGPSSWSATQASIEQTFAATSAAAQRSPARNTRQLKTFTARMPDPITSRASAITPIRVESGRRTAMRATMISG